MGIELKVVTVNRLLNQSDLDGIDPNKLHDMMPYRFGTFDVPLEGIRGRDASHLYCTTFPMKDMSPLNLGITFFLEFRVKIIRGILEFFDGEFSRDIFVIEKKMQRENPAYAQFALIGALIKYLGSNTDVPSAFPDDFPLMDFLFWGDDYPVLGRDACIRMASDFDVFINSAKTSAINETMREAILRNTYRHGFSPRSQTKMAFELTLDDFEKMIRFVAADSTGSTILTYKY